MPDSGSSAGSNDSPGAWRRQGLTVERRLAQRAAIRWVLEQTAVVPPAHPDLPLFVVHLEAGLAAAATSLADYHNPATLEARLQAVAHQLVQLQHPGVEPLARSALQEWQPQPQPQPLPNWRLRLTEQERLGMVRGVHRELMRHRAVRDRVPRSTARWLAGLARVEALVLEDAPDPAAWSDPYTLASRVQRVLQVFLHAGGGPVCEQLTAGILAHPERAFAPPPQAACPGTGGQAAAEPSAGWALHTDLCQGRRSPLAERDACRRGGLITP